jgi:uncharacterized protein YbaR (Trm112 family)
MPAPHDSHAQSREFDSRLVEQLACPVCFGALQLDSQESQICCVGCKRIYPLIDGIPVLISERASGPETPRSNDQSSIA